MAPIQWNSWETNWSGQGFFRNVNEIEQKQVLQQKKRLLKQVGSMVDLVLTTHKDVTTTTTTTLQDTIRDTFRVDHQTRSGN